MTAKTQEDLDLLRDAEREVAERGTKRAPATTSKVRFGARKGFAAHEDKFSTKVAPGPVGPSAAQLIEDAKRRRRERAEEERGRR